MKKKQYLKTQYIVFFSIDNHNILCYNTFAFRNTALTVPHECKARSIAASCIGALIVGSVDLMSMHKLECLTSAILTI